MTTNVYVDGFNLYYGCLKDTPYKWLDILKLSRTILQKHHRIHRIRYFTAMVQGRENDPQQPQRQQMFLRALKTIPNLSIHLGRFLSHPRRMPLVSPPVNGPDFAEVIRTEEKGSDVNLATYLLVDAFDSDYECAVLITNDSDLLEPVKLVRTKFRRAVGILNPHPPENTAWALMHAATFYRHIRTGALQSSQFPQTLQDATGTFHKPSAW